MSAALRTQGRAAAPDPEALARRVEELETRVARLEEGRLLITEHAPPVPPAVTEAIDEVSTSGPLALAGRTLIALGGGYLLRMVTTAGGLPSATGVALGLAYAAAWVAEADREARRGRALPSALAAGTGALLAYPLLWEASTRFGAIPPRAALVIATAFVLGAGAVGWRRERPSFGWLHLVPALLLSFGLLFHGHDAAAVLGTLAVLHAAAELAAARPSWQGMRWATGVAGVLLAVAVVSVPSAPGTLAALAALAGAVVVAAMARALRRAVDAYDLAAGTAGLALAVAAAAALPPALWWGPAAAALALAVAADRGAARAGTAPASAHALTLAGTALAIAASTVALGPGARVAAWCVLGLAAAWWSAAARRCAPASFAYLVAAIAASGALASGLRGVTGIGGWSPLTLAGFAAAAAAVGATAVMGTRSPGGRAARLAGAIVGGIGLAALATSAWPTAGVASAAGTGVLAAMAVAATLRGRVSPGMRALAWTLLAMGGLRLLLVDLRDGRPLTLFIGLVSYGAALLAAQAARARRAAGAHP